MVIPAVIEEERVQLNSAFLGQFVPECVDAIQRPCLVVRRKVAEIVPGIIVQKRPVRMRPFLL